MNGFQLRWKRCGWADVSSVYEASAIKLQYRTCPSTPSDDGDWSEWIDVPMEDSE